MPAKPTKKAEAASTPLTNDIPAKRGNLTTLAKPAKPKRRAAFREVSIRVFRTPREEVISVWQVWHVSGEPHKPATRTTEKGNPRSTRARGLQVISQPLPARIARV